MPTPSALQRQKDIYLQGLGGQRPLVPIDPEQAAEKARRKMSREAYAYVAGGAGLGDSVRHNRSDFNHWRIQPHMLRDVSGCDTALELLGQALPSPLLLSPVGVLDMAHPQADLAVARAAAALGLPYIFSNQASVPMEVAAGAMGTSPHWFQLYWSKSSDLVASFVRRAEACGCSAIVVTLDTTMLGWRTQDLDLAFLPFLRGQGIAQYTSDPVFRQLMQVPSPTPPPKRRLTPALLRAIWTLMHKHPGSFFHNLRSGDPLRAVRTFTELYTNPALNWADLAFLREHTKLPILLKGILRPDDARRAADAGVDGIIVSNHGGRQVDGAVSSIGALPGVVEAIGGRLPVLLDSGVRGGADMFKALALGARAVCIGRPYVYGLAIAGQAGVQEVLLNYMADFELTMRLSGCASLSDINPDMLAPAG